MGHLHRRGQVDVERALDLIDGVLVEAPTGRQRVVGDQDVDATGALDQVAAACPDCRSATSGSARSPNPSVTSRSASSRRPLSNRYAPRAWSACAIACPSPPVAPVRRTLLPSIASAAL
jgi:hypothetical protein